MWRRLSQSTEDTEVKKPNFCDPSERRELVPHSFRTNVRAIQISGPVTQTCLLTGFLDSSKYPDRQVGDESTGPWGPHGDCVKGLGWVGVRGAQGRGGKSPFWGAAVVATLEGW